MILLDTNVLSEPMRPRGNRQVIDWLRSNFDDLAVPVLALSELVYGIELVDDPIRRAVLTYGLAAIRQNFAERFVEFDLAAAERHGTLQAHLTHNGGRLPVIDSQIAAIALSRNARIATRNIRDFERTGVVLIDPRKVP